MTAGPYMLENLARHRRLTGVLWTSCARGCTGQLSAGAKRSARLACQRAAAREWVIDIMCLLQCHHSTQPSSQRLIHPFAV